MLKILLKIAFTCAAFWLAFRHVVWEDLKNAFHTQQPAYVWLALVMIMIQTIGGGLRWHVIRRALGSADSARHTTLLYYMSSFFNTCLPGTLGGDASRIWLAKTSGDRMQDIIYGIILDRLWSLAGLGLLVASTLFVLFPCLGFNRTTAIVITLCCWCLAVVKLQLLRKWLPQFPRTRFPFINTTVAALERLLQQYHATLTALFLALIAHIAYATAGWALAQSLGLELGWLVCITLIPFVLLITTLPISLGGWGIREVSMAGILGLVGVAKPEALALSLQLGLTSTFIGLFGGIAYLLHRRA